MLTYVLVIILALGVSAGLLGLWRYYEHTQRDAFQALAARRGWSLTLTERALGRPPLLRLSSRGGPEWEARARRVPGDRSLFRKVQTTEFIGQEPRWPDGALFVGSDQVPWPDDSAPPTAEDLHEALLRRIVGQGRHADLTNLTRLETPTGIAAFTTSDPGRRFDFEELANLWQSWRPRGPLGDGYPILQMGPEGIWVRLEHGTRTSHDMESFVDFALTAGRLVKDR